MPAYRDHAAWPEVRAGLKDAVPIAFGYLPLGIGYGMFAVSIGLPWYWVTITAAVIFAGSLEFIAAAMMVAGGPLASAALTTLFVNGRHLFYGLSVPIEHIRNPLARIYGVHALTDESYAVLSGLPREQLSGPRILAVEVSAHVYWVAGSTIGAVAATLIPFDLSFMGFSMTALFVILAIEAYRTRPSLGLFLAAVVCGVLALWLAPDALLLVALGSYCLVCVAALWWRRRA